MKIERKGCTRIVFLTKRYAIKVPSFFNWHLFLRGLICNMQERAFSMTGWDELCPVLFSIRGGWLVVMPRAREMSAFEFVAFDYEKFVNLDDGSGVVPAEQKASSFGWLGGRVVAIDYGG